MFKKILRAVRKTLVLQELRNVMHDEDYYDDLEEKLSKKLNRKVVILRNLVVVK